MMGISTILAVWFVAMFLACPTCTAIVAHSKGRDGLVWFAAGVFFGPFGLLAAIGVPPLHHAADPIS